jgi:hypothetical protein
MDWKLLFLGILFIIAGILYRMYASKKETNIKANPTQYLAPSTDKLEVRQNLTLSNETQSQLATLRDNFNINKGKFSTWLQITRSQRNTRLIEVLTENELAVIEHGAVIEKAVREKEKSELEYLRFLQEHRYELMELQTKEYLLQEATRNFLPLEDYVEVRKEELLTDLRIKEYLATDGRVSSVEKLKQESEIKLNEHRVKADIDHEYEVRDAQERLRLEIIARHLTNQQKISFIQDLVDEQFIKIEETRASTLIPEGAKQNMIDSRMRIVQMYERQQDEAQKAALHP